MSAAPWITAAPGIRYRPSARVRKHGARLDRYYTLRFSVAGKQVEEALGWASELNAGIGPNGKKLGWTVKLAKEKLGELSEARRTGQGHATMREEAEAKRRAARQRTEEEARTGAPATHRLRSVAIATARK